MPNILQQIVLRRLMERDFLQLSIDGVHETRHRNAGAQIGVSEKLILINLHFFLLSLRSNVQNCAKLTPFIKIVEEKRDGK